MAWVAVHEGALQTTSTIPTGEIAIFEPPSSRPSSSRKGRRVRSLARRPNTGTTSCSAATRCTPASRRCARVRRRSVASAGSYAMTERCATSRQGPARATIRTAADKIKRSPYANDVPIPRTGHRPREHVARRGGRKSAGRPTTARRLRSFAPRATPSRSCNNDTVTATGDCATVRVSGNQNTVQVDLVGAIEALGNSNTITWKRGPGGHDPSVSNPGNGNAVRKANPPDPPTKKARLPLPGNFAARLVAIRAGAARRSGLPLAHVKQRGLEPVDRENKVTGLASCHVGSGPCSPSCPLRAFGQTIRACVGGLDVTANVPIGNVERLVAR